MATFYNEYGGISSIRSSVNGLNLTTYIGSNMGGVTYNSKFGSVRFNNSGTMTSFSIKGRKGRSSYFDTNMRSITSLKGYK